MEPNYKEALRIVAQALAWHCFGECRSFGEDVPLLKPAEANTYAKFVLDMGAATQQMKGNTMEDYKNYYNKKNVQPQWARDVAQIAERQIERIKYLINEKKAQRAAFNKFLNGLQKNINPSIDEDQAIEMLAQHIITQPIFDALFEGYSFVNSNAVSIAMQGMIKSLEEGSNLAEQDETLQRFYESVRKRADGIDNSEGKQRIIIELYDKFFKTAFPKMVEKLGIVYTPVEVVDFIVHSVADILQMEFGRNISDENIHILEPFTGTGTFITRLLQSGVINSRDLARKYTQEIHCNEIVLLAYYIAAVNIENTFHDLQPESNTTYIPFDGICLTDTFQLGESKDGEKLFSEMFDSKLSEEREKSAAQNEKMQTFAKALRFVTPSYYTRAKK
jgi:predicted helicase